MSSYKHYCFELCPTLLKSNPHFQQERNHFFYNHLNFNGKSEQEVALSFRKVDLMCKDINEITGKNIDPEQMYLMVIDMLNDHLYPLKKINLSALLKQMDLFFFDHMPHLCCADTIDLLCHLKERPHTNMSILSNTGFIKGKTLREVVKRLGLEGFFAFQLYADETGIAKPNKALFELVYENICKYAKIGNFEVREIIYVTDHPEADLQDVHSVGIKSLLTPSF